MKRASRRESPSRDRQPSHSSSNKGYRTCGPCHRDVYVSNWARHARSQAHVDAIVGPTPPNQGLMVDRRALARSRSVGRRRPSEGEQITARTDQYSCDPNRETRLRPRESSRSSSCLRSPRTDTGSRPSSPRGMVRRSRSSPHDRITRRDMRQVLSVLLSTRSESYRGYLEVARAAAPWFPDAVLRMAATAVDMLNPNFWLRPGRTRYSSSDDATADEYGCSPSPRRSASRSSSRPNIEISPAVAESVVDRGVAVPAVAAEAHPIVTSYPNIENQALAESQHVQIDTSSITAPELSVGLCDDLTRKNALTIVDPGLSNVAYDLEDATEAHDPGSASPAVPIAPRIPSSVACETTVGSRANGSGSEVAGDEHCKLPDGDDLNMPKLSIRLKRLNESQATVVSTSLPVAPAATTSSKDFPTDEESLDHRLERMMADDQLLWIGSGPPSPKRAAPVVTIDKGRKRARTTTEYGKASRAPSEKPRPSVRTSATRAPTSHHQSSKELAVQNPRPESSTSVRTTGVNAAKATLTSGVPTVTRSQPPTSTGTTHPHHGPAQLKGVATSATPAVVHEINLSSQPTTEGHSNQDDVPRARHGTGRVAATTVVSSASGPLPSLLDMVIPAPVRLPPPPAPRRSGLPVVAQMDAEAQLTEVATDWWMLPTGERTITPDLRTAWFEFLKVRRETTMQHRDDRPVDPRTAVSAAAEDVRHPTNRRDGEVDASLPHSN